MFHETILMNPFLIQTLHEFNFHPLNANVWTNGNTSVSINTMKLVVQKHYIAEIATYCQGKLQHVFPVKSIEELKSILLSINKNEEE